MISVQIGWGILWVLDRLPCHVPPGLHPAILVEHGTSTCKTDNCDLKCRLSACYTACSSSASGSRVSQHYRRHNSWDCHRMEDRGQHVVRHGEGMATYVDTKSQQHLLWIAYCDEWRDGRVDLALLAWLAGRSGKNRCLACLLLCLSCIISSIQRAQSTALFSRT